MLIHDQTVSEKQKLLIHEVISDIREFQAQIRKESPASRICQAIIQITHKGNKRIILHTSSIKGFEMPRIPLARIQGMVRPLKGHILMYFTSIDIGARRMRTLVAHELCHTVGGTEHDAEIFEKEYAKRFEGRATPERTKGPGRFYQ